MSDPRSFRVLAVAAAFCLVLVCLLGSLADARRQGEGREANPGELLIVLHQGVDAPLFWGELKSMGLNPLRKGRGGQWGLIRLSGDPMPKMWRKVLARNPKVKSLETNHVLHGELAFPDDPLFDQQWFLYNVGQEIQGYAGSAGADMSIPQAWEIMSGEGAVVLALIDSGLYMDHEDLGEVLWINPREMPGNQVDDDGNGYVDDVMGWDFVQDDHLPEPSNCHGTGMAGLIRANTGNALGIAGVTAAVRLMVLKIGDTLGKASVARAVEAIDYAIDNGAHIIQFSFGNQEFSEVLRDAIARAEAAGILFVCSAGNGGSDGIGDINGQTPHYPSDYDLPNILAVTATDQDDLLLSFANRALVGVDLGAPGKNILTTGCEHRGDYNLSSGTSASSALVSGVAALVKAHTQETGYRGVKARLMNGTDPLASLAGKTRTGGRVNAFKALQTVQPLPESEHPYGPENNLFRSYTMPGSAVALKITFDTMTETEAFYDYIFLTDQRGRRLPGSPFSGRTLSGAQVVVPGDSLGVRLCSDDVNAAYGYRVAGVEPLTLESRHPYDNDTVESRTFTYPGEVQALALYFDVATRTADDGDAVFIYDRSGQQVPGSPFIGASLSGRSVSVPGNRVEIQLITDPSGAAYGYRVWSIQPVFLESGHDYANNLDQLLSFTHDGHPTALKVTFDQMTEVEEGIDAIHVLDGTGAPIAGSPIGGFTGRALAGRTVTVPGKTVSVRLVSDASVTGFGYRIVDISPIYLQSPHPYGNNTTQSFSYTYPGRPGSLFVTFDLLTSTEEGFDWIKIYDGQGHRIPGAPADGYTGSSLAGKRLRVPGDTVVVEVLSDRFFNDYGFLINDISPDSDADGISDEEERLQGSDPFQKDQVFLDLHEGLNLFSYPVRLPERQTAQALKTFLGCTKISRLDQDTGRFQEAEDEDFTLEEGAGYLLELPSPREKVVFAGLCSGSPVRVGKGVNLTGLPCRESPYDAFDVVSELSKDGNRASLQRLSASSGRFETASIMDGRPVGVRFPIRTGEAYFLFSEQDRGWWWPSFGD
jgi:hypothetical protein